MKKLLTIHILATIASFAQDYSYSINTIKPNIEARVLKGHTWHIGCPIPLNNLRYLKISYFGFDGKSHIGEMIVNKSVANDVVQIFQELYKIKYPIKQMKLVSDFGGSDEKSMNANNTSAFNCRLMTGSKTKWSKHSYGRAIDINTIQNPYVAKGEKIVLPKAGKKYVGDKRKRLNQSFEYRAVILPNDKIVKIFSKYGWKWGGSWKNLKDYQHFEKVEFNKNLEKPATKSPKQLFDSLKGTSNKETKGDLF